MPPKNSGGSTKFPGGHKVIHRAAQTAFVRVVTPRIESYSIQTIKTPPGSQELVICAQISLEIFREASISEIFLLFSGAFSLLYFIVIRLILYLIN